MSLEKLAITSVRAQPMRKRMFGVLRSADCSDSRRKGSLVQLESNHSIVRALFGAISWLVGAMKIVRGVSKRRDPTRLAPRSECVEGPLGRCPRNRLVWDEMSKRSSERGGSLKQMTDFRGRSSHRHVIEMLRWIINVTRRCTMRR
jgi:hypothetical protein